MVEYSKVKDGLKPPVCDLEEEGWAFLTHYLQGLGSPESKKLFCKKALQFAKKSKNEKSEIEDLSQLKDDDLNWDVPFPPLKANVAKFTFIDLFAGVGGFRMAMQQLGGRCVFTSEWDKYSKRSYEANYGEVPFGDITKINAADIPNHDVLCAGFPCQAFSLAGQKKGFEDTRGTLFFDIARIIAEKKPKAFFLENVKGLVSHDKSRTLKKILDILRYDLGYFVPEIETIKAQDFGVPQKRERVFILGFSQETKVGHFEYPEPSGIPVAFSDVKEEKTVASKYYVSTNYLKALKNHRAKHESKGNGFGYVIIGDDAVANTIVIGGMGKERNLVLDHRLTDFKPTTHIKGEVNREGIRRMTPREWARLQGYSDEFRIVVSDAQAYKQFANSVAVPAIKATALKVLEALRNPQPRKGQLEFEDLQRSA